MKCIIRFLREILCQKIFFENAALNLSFDLPKSWKIFRAFYVTLASVQGNICMTKAIVSMMHFLREHLYVLVKISIKKKWIEIAKEYA